MTRIFGAGLIDRSTIPITSIVISPPATSSGGDEDQTLGFGKRLQLALKLVGYFASSHGTILTTWRERGWSYQRWSPSGSQCPGQSSRYGERVELS